MKLEANNQLPHSPTSGAKSTRNRLLSSAVVLALMTLSGALTLGSPAWLINRVAGVPAGYWMVALVLAIYVAMTFAYASKKVN